MFDRIRRTAAELKSSTSGNSAMLVALGMPALIGGAGLAVDTAQWYMWKRELQFAVDQAALAGAWARTDGETESLFQQRAIQELDSNLSVTTDFVETPSVSIEDYANGTENSVLVSVAATKQLPFSSFLTGNSTTVYASAQASFGDATTYSACILAVNEHDSGSIIIQGNVTLAQSCGIAALSDSDEAIVKNGEASDPGTGDLTAVGGIDDDFDDIEGLQINEYVSDLYDPYKDLVAPLDGTAKSYACEDVYDSSGSETSYYSESWTNSNFEKQKYSSSSSTTPTDASSWSADSSDTTYPYAENSTKIKASLTELPDGTKAGKTYTTTGSWTTTAGPTGPTSTPVYGTGKSKTTVIGYTYTWTRIRQRDDGKVEYFSDTKATKTKIGELATLQPGTYSGGFHVKCNTTLTGGIYVIDGGSFKVNSTDTVTSTSGVMIVLKNGATIDINGGSGISLRPMSKGELDTAIATGDDITTGSDTELLAGMLVMEVKTGSGLNSSTINGNAGLTLNGTIYMPQTDLDLSGTASVSSQCLMIAASKIKFSGNMEFTSLCPDDDTETAGSEIGEDPGGVRLVA